MKEFEGLKGLRVGEILRDCPKKTSRIFDRICWTFLILEIGIGLGYAWAYKVFG